jgi:hypothetical protein|tara:strand:+ start:751 stop:924 length:174 start_codon:yes stop_codon:yes gene_type:complete
MSNLQNDIILEDLYEDIYDRLIKAGFSESESEWAGELLAHRMFDSGDYGPPPPDLFD